MKKIYLLLACIMASSLIYGQSYLHYEFNNSLAEVNGNGPTLSVLSTAGVYVQDTLLEIGSAEKLVYRFEANSGFQFDNTAASDFLGNDYTIELYFVFDQLNSWKRVVDWKNRTSDNGAYVYYGKLNFYPYQYSGEAPVHDGEYTYYVITRNGTTNELIIYTDAVHQIGFVDNGGDAILGEDNVLNFFHDDLVVGNEASSGAVAMLKLYNYALDSATIAQKYEDLAGNVFRIEEKGLESVQVNVWPNPVSDHITIDLGAFKDEDVSIHIINSLGKTIYQSEHGGSAEESITISLQDMESGMYILRMTSGQKLGVQKVMVY